MPISDFPTNATLFRDYEDPEEPNFAVSKSPDFGDGSFDVNLDSDDQIRRWTIRYNGRSASDFTALDAHAEAAKYNPDVGSAYVFNFTTRSGEVLANVRYARGGFKRGHTKSWIQSREIVLEKLP